MSGKGSSQDREKQEDLLPLAQRSFDLCIALYNHVNRFPKAHKSLLGRDILNAVQQMLIYFITATRSRDRLSALEEADLYLEKIRILARLAHSLTFLPHKAYETIFRELIEIGKMLGGWLKASRGSSEEFIKDSQA